MSACLDDDALLAFAEGGLPAADRRAAREHAESCESCRLALSACVRLVAEAKGSQEGNVLGRFVVEREIGRGGMGIVYAAVDPDLGRRIALKVLPPWLAGNERARARLLREARTMARLVHPNVVSIFDVGTLDDGRMFLAMELVEGENLRLHLRTPRPWRHVVRLFVDAGRGLAEAHAMGIVHRDVKPDNLLVTADGRAKLGDFGLARLEDLEEAEADSLRGAEPPAAAQPALTGAGAVLGTPAYMAPEQAAGGDVDARSDQYSLAIALHEALHGVRPAGEPPRGSNVPATVRAIVSRALEADPARRYPALAEMLDALEAELARVPWRRRALFIAAIVAGVVAALATAFALWPRAADPPRGTAGAGSAALACGARLARWDGVWSPERKRAAKDAFDRRAREAPWAGDAYRRFDGAMAAYIAAGRREEEAACGARSEADRRGREECLDLLASDLEAIVGRASGEATPQRVRRAASAVLALEPASICARAKPDEPLAAETARVWTRWEEANRAAHVAASLGEPWSTSSTLLAAKPGPEKRKAAAFALTRAIVHDGDAAPDVGATKLAATLADAGLAATARELEGALATQRSLTEQARGAAAGRSAADMLALATEGGAASGISGADRFVSAIAEAESLGLDVLAVRARIERARAASPPPGDDAIAELGSAVARVGSRELDHELDATLTELSARRGALRPSPLRARCSSDAGEKADAGCALTLAAAADASVSLDAARDEAAVASATFGPWHPAHARALVHEAEALVGGGSSGEAPARAALAIAEGDPTLLALVVRARAALAESGGAVRELDAVMGAGGRATDDAILVPAVVARARLARRAGRPSPDEVARLRAALPRIRHGAQRGRAWTEIGLAVLARGDRAGASAALTEALAFAPLLGSIHRSELRFGAARALAGQKRDAARALAEEAAREAPDGERAAIEAWLRRSR